MEGEVVGGRLITASGRGSDGMSGERFDLAANGTAIGRGVAKEMVKNGTSPWPHFSISELMCHCCYKAEMDFDYMARLEKLRVAYDRPMHITSAYRCPDHNDAVAKTGRRGPHTTGRAVDIAVYGKDAFGLLQLALKFGFTGIGVAQSGPYLMRILHLDDLPEATGRPRPRIWSYGNSN